MTDGTDDKQQGEAGVFRRSIQSNIKRKSVYVDKVQLHDGVPLFSWLDINITEMCNRRCVFCPRNDPAKYPNQALHMDPALAARIAEELKRLDFQGGVLFCGYGEPLMHPAILDIVRPFKGNLHTEIVTNGDRLHAALARQLVDAGISMILVSLYDGPHQVDEFKRMFQEAGVGEDHYILRDRWYSLEEGYGLKLTNRAGAISVGDQPPVEPHAPCFYCHYSLQLDWNGDVMLCVQDFNKKVKFGNLYARSLLDIWRSDNARKYRETLGRGHRVLYPCNQCNVKGTLHGSAHARAWADIYDKERT